MLDFEFKKKNFERWDREDEAEKAGEAALKAIVCPWAAIFAPFGFYICVVFEWRGRDFSYTMVLRRAVCGRGIFNFGSYQYILISFFLLGKMVFFRKNSNSCFVSTTLQMVG